MVLAGCLRFVSRLDRVAQIFFFKNPRDVVPAMGIDGLRSTVSDLQLGSHFDPRTVTIFV